MRYDTVTPASEPRQPRLRIGQRMRAVRDFFAHPPAPDPLFGGAAAAPGTAELVTRIVDFLALNGLDATPANYQLAYEAIRAGGDALGGSIAYSAPTSPAGSAIQPDAHVLDELIEVAQQAIGRLDGVVRQSTADAHAYGSALATSVAGMEVGGGSGEMADALLALTRAMIERTRHAERRLADMGQEIEQLQHNLAEARAVAARDPLTGLPNRAAIEERLAEAMAAAARLRAPLAFAYCDVDDFKRINDEFGHAVGDRVLKLVADALRETGRAGELVGRLGGDEFVMLFEGSTADAAGERVDSIRATLAARSLRVRGEDRPLGTVTLSAGVAPMLPGDQPADLTTRADEGLLAAKRAGRNRVVVNQPERAADAA
ncbi:MAG: GGDEF domain-containing protein [Sphingomonas fennica]